MSNFVQLIKQISDESNAAGMPVALMFGTVTSASPLTINVEQKLNLTSDFLILTNAVKDHVVYMTVDHETEEAEELNADHTHDVSASTEPPTGTEESGGSGSVSIQEAKIDLTHKHKYKGKKKFTVHNGLKVGESVVLLRMQKGQKFLVLDRLGGS